MITVKWSTAALGDAAALAKLAQPMAVARATANQLRQRVLSGRTATPPKPYAQRPTSGPRRHKSYYVAPAYAEALGLGDQTKFRSSADFHAATNAKAGTGSLTGGLWRSLQVRNWGKDAAVIEFGGSSLGAKSTRTAITKTKAGTFEVTVSKDGKVAAKQAREFVRTEDGKVKYRRKPRLERNAVKAAAVFKHSRIGLLQCTDAEAQAQVAAVMAKAGILVAACFGASSPTASPGGDRNLYAAILREMR